MHRHVSYSAVHVMNETIDAGGPAVVSGRLFQILRRHLARGDGVWRHGPRYQVLECLRGTPQLKLESMLGICTPDFVGRFLKGCRLPAPFVVRVEVCAAV